MKVPAWFKVLLVAPIPLVGLVVGFVVAWSVPLAPLFGPGHLYGKAYAMLATYWVTAVATSAVLLRACRLGAEARRAMFGLSLFLTTVPVLLWFSHEPPLERGAQKRAMLDLSAIGDTLEEARRRTGAYPTAASIPELESVLGVMLSSADPWGGRYEIESRPNAFTLTALGADGKRDAVVGPGQTKSFQNDIVFQNGGFVTYPEGTQK